MKEEYIVITLKGICVLDMKRNGQISLNNKNNRHT